MIYSSAKAYFWPVNLVTGGTGLVGSHLLLQLCKAGEPVIALKRASSSLKAIRLLFDRNNMSTQFEHIEWVDGDLNDVFLLDKICKKSDYLYHCAALVSFDKKDTDALIKVNINGTANIVNAALSNGIKKMVYVSSTAAIGKQPKVDLIDESCEWSPDFGNNDYSMSKHFAELEVWRAAEEGLDVVMVNPAVIVGPGDWGKSSTNLIKTVDKGLKFYSSGGNAFVDVRDVARGMVALMQSSIVNERFLFASENMRFKDFFDLVADRLGKKRPGILARPWMGTIAGIFGEGLGFFTGKRPLVTRATAKSAQSIQKYSNRKIIDALSFEFTPIAQSIDYTCSYYPKSK